MHRSLSHADNCQEMAPQYHSGNPYCLHILQLLPIIVVLIQCLYPTSGRGTAECQVHEFHLLSFHIRLTHMQHLVQ
jgi:hypothetical protein